MNIEDGKKISKSDFIKIMASGKEIKLINDNNAPINEIIHPLTYSMDTKNHPDMLAISVSYKFQRKFKKLFDVLKKI